MTIKTLEATYEGGALLLEEPLDLEPRSRVRVRVEIPSSPSTSTADLQTQLDEAYGDTPDEDEAALQEHMARLRRKQTSVW